MTIAIDNKWDLRFLKLGVEISQWSKDPDIKVGAVLVDPEDGTQYVTGFNGFPKGVIDTTERYTRKKIKHKLILHAEINAILNARRDLSKYTLYSTRFPCLHCTLTIIQAGIRKVVTTLPNSLDIWKHKTGYQTTIGLFEEAGVDLVIMHDDRKYPLGELNKELFGSKERDDT